jgi:hypothetical protein
MLLGSDVELLGLCRQGAPAFIWMGLCQVPLDPSLGIALARWVGHGLLWILTRNWAELWGVWLILFWCSRAAFVLVDVIEFR